MPSIRQTGTYELIFSSFFPVKGQRKVSAHGRNASERTSQPDHFQRQKARNRYTWEGPLLGESVYSRFRSNPSSVPATSRRSLLVVVPPRELVQSFDAALLPRNARNRHKSKMAISFRTESTRHSQAPSRLSTSAARHEQRAGVHQKEDGESHSGHRTRRLATKIPRFLRHDPQGTVRQRRNN